MTMLKIKDYPTLRRLYPEASFIASDLGCGISMDEDDALGFAAVPVYFEDERGRFYFDGAPVYEEDVYIENDRPEYPREYLGSAW